MLGFQRAVVAAALALPAGGGAGAQHAPKAPPQIIVSGFGEVRVPPDLATITIGVQVRAATASEASGENGRKQKAVIDAVRARGVASQQITTSGYVVQPEMRYDKGGAPPTIAGYLVSNTVIVRLTRLEMTGAVIDASIAAGANEISSLAFSVSNPDSARRAAIAVAVARAKGDAETAARAAGGSLGAMLDLTVGEAEVPGPRPVAFSSRMKGPETPIEPGSESVTATVSVRWQFLPSVR
ncbi:MAG TPA: SIMPL domain-containing protein [Gemmatimonadaceae bacterium]